MMLLGPKPPLATDLVFVSSAASGKWANAKRANSYRRQGEGERQQLGMIFFVLLFLFCVGLF